MPSHYSTLNFHIIFSTKHRQPWIAEEWRDSLHGFIGGIMREERGVLHAAGSIEDHIHLLVGIHPSKSISDYVRDFKANSSRWVHETVSGCDGFTWQTGYAAFSVSLWALGEVRDYLAQQREHHRPMTFIEELKLFLDRHEVEYDPKYLEE